MQEAAASIGCLPRLDLIVHLLMLLSFQRLGQDLVIWSQCRHFVNFLLHACGVCGYLSPHWQADGLEYATSSYVCVDCDVAAMRLCWQDSNASCIEEHPCPIPPAVLPVSAFSIATENWHFQSVTLCLRERSVIVCGDLGVTFFLAVMTKFL